MRGPVDLDVRVRGDQLAVGAVQHVQEAVLVGLDHHLPRLAADLDIGEHVLVGAVHVVHVIGRVLKITDDFTGLRPDREHAGRVQAVHALARPGIVGLRIARAPVDEVELGISTSRSATSARRPASRRRCSGARSRNRARRAPGIVYRRHSFFPVSGSQPSRNPRVVDSPPAIPEITTPLATIGALVA